MEAVKIDHVGREIREIFGIGRRDHLLSKSAMMLPFISLKK